MSSAFDGYLPRERVELEMKCNYCGGKGDIGPAKSAEGDWLDQPCPECGGKGKVKRSS